MICFGNTYASWVKPEKALNPKKTLLNRRKIAMLFKTFITITISTSFLNFISINVWASNPNQYMPGLDDEKEKRSSLTSKSVQLVKKERKRKKTLEVVERIELEEEEIPLTLVEISHTEVLPDEILQHIFSFLTVEDLGRVSRVSIRWRKVSANPGLWRYIGLQKYGDYLGAEDLKENPRQNIINYHLSTKYPQASTVAKKLIIQGDLKAIHQATTRILEGCSHVYDSKDGYKDEDIEYLNDYLIKKSDSMAIKRKIKWLTEGVIEIKNPNYYIPKPGEAYYSSWIQRTEFSSYRGQDAWGRTRSDNYRKHKQDPQAVRELNDILVMQGDVEAIKRKIEGVINGKHGYVKNPKVVKELDEILFTRDDSEAIERKTIGLAEGRYGYEYDPDAARVLNETFINRGNPRAIKRKIGGLAEGKYGYRKNSEELNKFIESFFGNIDINTIKKRIEELRSEYKPVYHEEYPEALRVLNDFLVERGDPGAIKRKILGLEGRKVSVVGYYGYEKDLKAARELNEALVKKGYIEAIKRKIRGLFPFRDEKYGYKPDLKALREFLDFLIKNGDMTAIIQLIEKPKADHWGYERSLKAIKARELNDFLVERDDPDAIKRKIEGLKGGDYRYGKYGYENSPRTLREFNEILISKGDQEAIQRKIVGIRDGKYGYEKNSKLASEILVENGDSEAIKQKIEGLSEGNFGYEQDVEKARGLVECLVMQADPEGIKLKIKVMQKESMAMRKILNSQMRCLLRKVIQRLLGEKLKALQKEALAMTNILKRQEHSLKA